MSTFESSDSCVRMYARFNGSLISCEWSIEEKNQECHFITINTRHVYTIYYIWSIIHYLLCRLWALFSVSTNFRVFITWKRVWASINFLSFVNENPSTSLGFIYFLYSIQYMVQKILFNENKFRKTKILIYLFFHLFNKWNLFSCNCFFPYKHEYWVLIGFAQNNEFLYLKNATMLSDIYILVFLLLQFILNFSVWFIFYLFMEFIFKYLKLFRLKQKFVIV